MSDHPPPPPEDAAPIPVGIPGDAPGHPFPAPPPPASEEAPALHHPHQVEVTTLQQTEPDESLQRRRASEAVSLIALILVALGLCAALYMYIHDGTKDPLIAAISAVILKGGTVVDYWLGSSNSSQRKDAIISRQLPG